MLRSQHLLGKTLTLIAESELRNWVGISGIHSHLLKLKWMSSSSSSSSSSSGGATVMSFGDGSQGALGLPSSPVGLGVDAYEPTSIPSLPSDIVSVSAGHYHSLAVTSHGHLWAWGKNNEAQLGRGLAPREWWHEPKRVMGLEKVNVCAAFASGVVSAALGDDGSVWVWGKSKRGQLGVGKDITEAVAPARVEALAGEKIAKVSFGWGHALAQTVDGKLFGWGYYADGRIGKMGKELQTSALDSISVNSGIRNKRPIWSSDLEVAEERVLEGMDEEKNMPIVWEPRMVEELDGVEVVDIACGLDHSLILCRDGTLLSCGSNVYGQLGRSRGDHSLRNHSGWCPEDLGMLPVDINGYGQRLRPISIAAGLGHSFAICKLESDVGRGPRGTTVIASWGWNSSSQLGRSGPEGIPFLIHELDEENPISVSGGRAHSIALTSWGDLWVWGSGRNGRLGLGISSNQVEPVYLQSLEGFEILQAVSGFDHNLLLVAE